VEIPITGRQRGNYSEFGTVIANPDGTFDCFGQTRFAQFGTQASDVQGEADGEVTKN
jgi:hypothetical protein